MLSKRNKWFGLGLWCLTPLSTIFQLYRGGEIDGVPIYHTIDNSDMQNWKISEFHTLNLNLLKQNICQTIVSIGPRYTFKPINKKVFTEVIKISIQSNLSKLHLSLKRPLMDLTSNENQGMNGYRHMAPLSYFNLF